MKREWSKARKLGIQNKFEKWCEVKGFQPDPDSFIKFDAENGNVFLDHEKAKRDGYYAHLRIQAAAVIASWATMEPLKPNAGSVPFTASPKSGNVRLQYSYDIPGKGAVPVAKMGVSELKWLIDNFRIEAENKIKRAYILANRLQILTETRKDVS